MPRTLPGPEFRLSAALGALVIGLGGLGLAVERAQPLLAPCAQRLHQSTGRLAHQHGPGPGSGFEADGVVQGVAPHRAGCCLTTAARPEHDRTGVHADPHRKGLDSPSLAHLHAVGAHLIDDAQRGPNRSLRVVLVDCRCTEQGDDSLTGDTAHRPA